MAARRDSRGRFVGGGGGGPGDEFEWDDEEFQKRLADAGTLLYQNLRRAFDLAGLLHERKLKSYHRAPPARTGLIPTKPASSPLSTITGGLLGALSSGRELRGEKLADLMMTRYVGRGIPYARAQEEGATIRPVRRKVLTIPTIHARTQAGDVRGRVPHFKGYWRRSKSGALWFFQDGTNLPLFLGVTQVRIPPRLKFKEFWGADKDLRTRMFARAVSDALDGKVYAAGR